MPVEKSPSKQIDILVRAAYPIVYIVSYEETRVREELKQVAKARSRKFYTWSKTKGLANEEEAQQGGEELCDPLNALEYVARSREESICVFTDLHAFIGDETVNRKVCELADSLKTEGKMLVLLSPILVLPPELEKRVTVVDWPLPNEDEIAKLLDQAIAKINARGLSLKFQPEQREKIIKSCLGMTGDEIDNVLSKSLVMYKNIDLQVLIDEKQQIIRKSGILEFFPTSEGLETVGGVDNLKTWLKKRGNAFSEKAKAYGLPQPKGLLLLGVQGCGKSLVCKACASLWQMPLLRFDIGRVFSGIVGSSEENIRKALATAEAVSPCVLWSDEIDKGASGMQSSSHSDAGTTARVVGTLLTWLQEKTAPVFMIATCNSIENLPPELLRRFDEIFFVDLPSVPERIEIFTIHLAKRGREASKFDLNALAEAANNFSGAEIERAIVSGMFDAFDEGVEVQTSHIIKAINETVPLATTMKEKIDALRTWALSRARPASSVFVSSVRQGERRIEF